jgi:hypothetical protein
MSSMDQPLLLLYYTASPNVNTLWNLTGRIAHFHEPPQTKNRWGLFRLEGNGLWCNLRHHRHSLALAGLLAKFVATPGAPRGQQSVTTPHHGLFPPLFFSSFRWDTPKGKIIRQNHHLEHKHLLRLAANGVLNNPKARPAVSTQET